MVMMLDDYHNVHAKKVPQKLKTSTAVHMASSVLDIHVGIPAVRKPVNIPLHRPVSGGIAPDVVNSIVEEALRSMRRTYIEQIHPKLLQINPAKLIQSMREMR